MKTLLWAKSSPQCKTASDHPPKNHWLWFPHSLDLSSSVKPFFCSFRSQFYTWWLQVLLPALLILQWSPFSISVAAQAYHYSHNNYNTPNYNTPNDYKSAFITWKEKKRAKLNWILTQWNGLVQNIQYMELPTWTYLDLLFYIAVAAYW